MSCTDKECKEKAKRAAQRKIFVTVVTIVIAFAILFIIWLLNKMFHRMRGFRAQRSQETEQETKSETKQPDPLEEENLPLVEKHSFRDFEPSLLVPWYIGRIGSKQSEKTTPNIVIIVRTEPQMRQYIIQRPYQAGVEFFYTVWPVLDDFSGKRQTLENEYMDLMLEMAEITQAGVLLAAETGDPRVDQRLLGRMNKKIAVIKKMNALLRQSGQLRYFTVQAYHQACYWLTAFPEELWPEDDDILEYMHKIPFNPNHYSNNLKQRDRLKYTQKLIRQKYDKSGRYLIYDLDTQKINPVSMD